ncbi:MAG: hypothetical protein ACNA7J_15695 [Wenzhouxiangella sp.]
MQLDRTGGGAWSCSAAGIPETLKPTECS